MSFRMGSRVDAAAAIQMCVSTVSDVVRAGGVDVTKMTKAPVADFTAQLSSEKRKKKNAAGVDRRRHTGIDDVLAPPPHAAAAAGDTRAVTVSMLKLTLNVGS